jgi:hypothetical protein
MYKKLSESEKENDYKYIYKITFLFDTNEDSLNDGLMEERIAQIFFFNRNSHQGDVGNLTSEQITKEGNLIQA